MTPETGRFAVTNWVMRGPGQSVELDFLVDTRPVLDGQGIRTVWREAGTGRFFGELTRTQDPETGELVQHWYAANGQVWSQTRRRIEIVAGGYDEAFEGEDPFGAFEARVRTRHGPDGYRWTIERRYPGTDWFVVDRGEAVRFEE